MDENYNEKVAKSLYTEVGDESVTSLLANENGNKCRKRKSLGQNMPPINLTSSRSVPCNYISNHIIKYSINSRILYKLMDLNSLGCYVNFLVFLTCYYCIVRNDVISRG